MKTALERYAGILSIRIVPVDTSWLLARGTGRFEDAATIGRGTSLRSVP